MRKEKNAVNKTGFTLVELLMVVVIIGLLTAVALPGYRKSVEKSRAADALTTMQAVSKSEHAWYLTNNDYTKDFSDLDIDLTDANGNKADNASFANALYTYELLDTGILAGRNNREYSIYQDYETKQIMCTPGSHYICENLGAFTKEPCEKVGMAWANTNSTCYVDEEERCKGLYADELGEDIWNGTFCGYTNTNGQELNEGMECKATSWYNSCQYSTINSGGICTANAGIGNACRYSIIHDGGICQVGCNYSTITAGGICEGTCDYSTVDDGGVCKGTCKNSTINNGGECVGDAYGACAGSNFNGKAICRGNAHGGCDTVTFNGPEGICLGNGPYSCNHANLYSGSSCVANGVNSCLGTKIYSGSVCEGNNSSSCSTSTVYRGGICKGLASGSCTSQTVQEGGECWANAASSCTGTYQGTGATSGCCRGQYCPSNAPRCECPNHERINSSGNCITA